MNTHEPIKLIISSLIEKGIEKHLQGLDCCDKKRAIAEWYRNNLLLVYKELVKDLPKGFEKDLFPSLDLATHQKIQDLKK